LIALAEHSAQITSQTCFRLYKKLAGMSGTAAQNRREPRRVYDAGIGPRFFGATGS